MIDEADLDRLLTELSLKEFDAEKWLNDSELSAEALQAYVTICWDVFLEKMVKAPTLEEARRFIFDLCANSFRLGWETHKEYGVSTVILKEEI